MNYISIVVIVGSIVIVSIAAGYVLLALKSSRTFNEMQQNKLKELEVSERRLVSLFEHSLAGMFKFDVNTFEIIDANLAFREMLNCNDMPIFLKRDLVFPDEDIVSILTELKINHKISDYEIQCSPLRSEPFWALLSAQSINGENYAHGVLIDINHRKKVEEKNEEQAALLNETQDAIIVLDENGTVTFWNYSATSLYGIPQHDAIGKLLRNLIYSHDIENDYDQIWNDLIIYKEWYGIQQQYDKNGKNILVDGNWKKISSKATGRDIVLIVNTDITEKRKIEDKYLRAQKMETLALLTGGIAHDLQNILAPCFHVY
jgi:PAS domain S-box-containing protein